MEEMHYEENSFDFITFGAVLEHLYDPNHSLEKALQWLKPAGIIHVEVPSSEWLISKLINRYYRLRCTRFVTNISPMHEPFHLYEFAVKSFQMNGIRSGYEVAYYKHFVGEIPSVPKIFHPLLKTYMKWSNKGLQLVIWLRKPESKTMDN
jgi:ubiquinone/menaquinone biosynthesis C-methylase UbiE